MMYKGGFSPKTSLGLYNEYDFNYFAVRLC